MRRAGLKKHVSGHDMRDLLITKCERIGLGMNQATAQFLVGHSSKTIDPNGYRKMQHDPEFVQAEWQKWRKFVDSEVATR